MASCKPCTFRFSERRSDSMWSFLRDVWCLSKPYFQSEQKWSAWGLLAAVIALNLTLVGINVSLNYWNNAFYDTLQNMDAARFQHLLLTWQPLPEGSWFPVQLGFTPLAFAYIIVAIYATYLTQWLQIRWRAWLNEQFTTDWLSDQVYYGLQLSNQAGHPGTDNPDQRIAEDLRDFVVTTLSLTVDFISNVVTLASFIGILWAVSGPITLWGVTIPGYMVFAALLYAVLGTMATHFIGRKLTALRFAQQKCEADYRYGLVRLRENAEGVALYRGEKDEKAELDTRFHALKLNWWELMLRTKKLNALIYGYQQAAVIFPFAMAAPRYFDKAIQLGGLMQIANAFGQVQGALSWAVSAYKDIATWRAVVGRLVTFQQAMEEARERARNAVTVTDTAGNTIKVSDLKLDLPNGARLLDGAQFTLEAGRSVLVTGASGSGKSTLFRFVAGIWPFAQGKLERSLTKCLFLPQRPYIPLGTLRRVVAFPAAANSYTDEQIKNALTKAGLEQLWPLIDTDDRWAGRLSGGEQQRIALARALLFRPDWLFLDEATASLDPKAESALYTTLKTELPNTTIVSIAHRESVAMFHDERIVVERGIDGQPGKLVRTTI